MDLQAAKSLARHLLKCPLWSEQIVGLSIDGRVNASLTRVLQKYDVAKQILRRVAETYLSEFPLLDMDGEKLFLMDHIQRLFTDDGSGDGHLIPDQARFFLVPRDYWFPDKVDLLDAFTKITRKEHLLTARLRPSWLA